MLIARHPTDLGLMPLQVLFYRVTKPAIAISSCLTNSPLARIATAA
jgi:hypothetical protein